MTGQAPPIRIAQMIQSVDAPAGGTSTAFLGVLGAIRTQPGLSVRAFSTSPPADDPHWPRITRDRAAHGENSWNLSATFGRTFGPGDLGRETAAAIASRQFDLLHLHGLWSPDLLHAARAARRAGIPYVWQPHGMLVRAAISQKRWKKELFLALGLRRALINAAAIIYCAHEEQDQSIPPRAIPRDRTHVVPLPLEIPDDLPPREQMRASARARFNIPADAPTVVFMGRLHHVKRVELAMDALAEASRTLPNLHLLLLGDGDGEYVAALKAHADRLGIASRVRFAGFISGKDKWPALAAGDVLTLNSKHENFGFVAVEALVVGTPPVMTSNLALAPELARVQGGFSCVSSAAALAGAYLEAIALPDRPAFVERGMAWVAQNLSSQAVGSTLAGLYRAILARR
jgi:glycosyltransferase involved in cell wall biosynthesis